MKKVYCMTIVVVAMLVVMPLMSMELFKSLLPVSVPTTLAIDNRNVILFAGDFSVVPIEKSHLPLIKALYPEYQKYKHIADKGGIIPSFTHISVAGLPLVNEALKVRPDEFESYYKKLSPKERRLLIKASGQYDGKGNKAMLNVPEITQRLIDVYFTDDGLGTHIKRYYKDEDEAEVRRYFKEKLIANKSLLTFKQSMFDKQTHERIREDIYLGSFFINAAHTINHYNYPIFLSTAGVTRKTYATHFGADNHEYRITDVDHNQCLLWCVDHNDSRATFSTPIKLKGPIKGCRLSDTQADIEYAVIYSKHDIVLATMARNKNKLYVTSLGIDVPSNSTIVDICFDPIDHNCMVGLYEGRKTVFRGLYKNGELSTNIKGSLPFKNEGLLEKISIYKGNSGTFLAVLLGVAQQYAIKCYKLSDSRLFEHFYSTRLHQIDQHITSSNFNMVTIENSIEMFDDSCPFFIKNIVAQEQKKHIEWSLKGLSDAVSSQFAQSESEIHRVYSPNGEFLMCNFLKKKLGTLYVETVLQDAITHKQILSIDTLYQGFVGVGFTPDTQVLIFVNSVGPHDKIPLLNDEDQHMLYEVEKLAFVNSGVTSLLKRLCMECRKKGLLTLQENDSTYSMLRDWAKISPTMLKVLQKCLPIEKSKK